MVRAQTDGEDWNWQLRLVAPDGQVRYAKSQGNCRRHADGSLESIIGVLADITELETARKGAEAATLAQSAFLANMSHEIRTPLNGVLGFVGLVLDSKLNATQRRYLTLVDESAKSLLTLLNDILDLSKVEAGLLEVAATVTDLRHTIVQALRLMAPLAEQKSIALSGKIDPAFPEAVMIDGARFRQILLNILGNAVKFTEHGSIAVSLEVDVDVNRQPILRAIVSDSGIGIPSGRLEAMFKPFVQADSSTSRMFGGSGLGLSISRQLAGLMGGTLTLSSVEGVGTTVEVMLPVLAAKIGDSIAAPALGQGAAGANDLAFGKIASLAQARPAKSILLVEDLELNRMLVGEMLKRLGHRVQFAENGVEGLAMAGRLASDPAAWDLILMDVQMPVMNGNDSTRAIRALGGVAATIPIIALSANAFATEIRQSRESGMNDHVVKPIDFALLSRTIDQWTRPAAPPRAAHRLHA
jgi:signal transduction histidine kinase/CheY-like chemotaxis protein